MKNINDLHTTGKSSRNIQSKKTKGFGYQVLGFGSGGGLPTIIEATGGTITCSGSYRIHTFTGPGTFEVTKVAPGPSGHPNSMDYLVGAGGGGGGSCCAGGGGGGGGYRESPGTATGCYSVSPRGVSPAVALTASVQSYPITVGAGGTAGGDACQGPRPTTLAGKGADSIFSTITSTGGGLGASFPNSGGDGGSGGGAAHANCNPAGSGNTPPTAPFPPQGTNGVTPSPAVDDLAGAGGGATVAAANTPTSRAGGTGGTTSITGGAVSYGGGGGGGVRNGAPPNADKDAFWPNASTCGSGGRGGLGFCAGSSSPIPQATGANGPDNKSGGGGGAARTDGPTYHLGGVGGSGVVIIRYKFQ